MTQLGNYQKLQSNLNNISNCFQFFQFFPDFGHAFASPTALTRARVATTIVATVTHTLVLTKDFEHWTPVRLT
jgi:hypothetical protein